jgi:hypothetical protein
LISVSPSAWAVYRTPETVDQRRITIAAIALAPALR